MKNKDPRSKLPDIYVRRGCGKAANYTKPSSSQQATEYSGSPNKEYRLSQIFGLYTLLILFIFSGTLLIWTYITTNNALLNQINLSFEQRRRTTQNIIIEEFNYLKNSAKILIHSDKIDQYIPGKDFQSLKLELDEDNENFERMPDILFITDFSKKLIFNHSAPLFPIAEIPEKVLDNTLSLIASSDFMDLDFESGNSLMLFTADEIIQEETGKILGYLYMGTVLENNFSLLQRIRKETGSEIVTISNKERLIATTDKRDSLLTSTISSAYKSVHPEELSRVRIDKQNYLVSTFYIYKNEEKTLRITFGIKSTPLENLKSDYFNKIIILVILLFIAFSMSIFLINKLSSKPLKRLVNYSDEVKSGQNSALYNAGYIKEFNHVGYSVESMVNTIKSAEFERIRLETAIEQISESIIITDKKGIIQYANSALEKKTGYTRSEILGNTPRIFKSNKHEHSFYEEMWNTIRNGKIWYGNIQNRIKNGAIIEEEVSITPIFDNLGDIVNYIAVRRDITDLLMIKEKLLQSQKMDALGQLAGGMAHDFNNMLSGIMSAAQLLKRPSRKLDEKGVKYTEMILQASKRAADLTARLLAFSRKGELASTSFDINLVISETMELLSRTLDKKIIINIDKKADNHKIIGNSSALQNAVMNLMINASHAMPEGGKILLSTMNVQLNQIYCRNSSFEISPGLYFQIEIRDTGVGIPIENLNKIFTPFFTTKKEGKGTGLGLTTVFDTVLDHHGEINVYSELGLGTSFHILLPCADANVSTKEESEELIKGTGLILLVDDEKLIQITGHDMLEEMGYTVIVAENGQDAVEIYKQSTKKIDLVIMDMIMPTMSGNEAFFKLKEFDKNCKIIITSGFARIKDLKKLQEAGLTDFIRKPFQYIELSQIINDILQEGKK